ncbi:MAG: DNA polymerase III subunit alpha, partial [Patescibacteria group bacterium]|nr:DNA polymerase III subunit alpha [Patescibacteria group bacterium]
MFTHLHVHSEFSLLDGLPTVKNLAQTAKKLGMESLALTDHGVMYGAHKFYQACKKAEIKPIIGCELYVAPRSRHKKVTKLDEHPFHLTVLAKDEVGYRNLIKLVSAGFLEGFYYKPRVDMDLLNKYSKGLIGLSGCLSGEIPKLILSGKTKQATESAKQYIDIFGKENFYIELQRNKLKEQDAANKVLLDIAKTLQTPIVATCDSHYLKKEDALAQEVLMCISTGKRLDDPKRMKFETDEFFLRTEDEMNELFKDLPQALKNTQAIAERCNVELKMKDWILPEPPIPDEYKNDYDKYLYDETFSRGQKKLGRKLTPVEKKRVEYEWKVISDKGFSSYMIMVAQFSHWIRERKIPMTVRGSAAGSLLAYCLDIISANPLKFNLAFERFLNPLRPKAPDIDIDVASSRREELIEYAIETYGKENTAHIVTFGRMQARGSIRDAGRVLGLPLGYVDKIAKLIPASGQGLAKVDIDLAIKKVPELSELLKQDTDAAKLIQTAKKIEGVAKSQGVHACGVLITPGPITDYCPVIWDKTLGKHGRMITQYEMDSIEDLGLIKMDFLGLTNLDTIAETIRIIKRERDIDIDPDDLPLDDEATYKLMRDLDTEGVFQFESEVMKNTLRILQPENIFDVSAALALVRPGPNQYQQEYADRKLGKKEVTYLDPRMKDYLSLTFGVLVYQEDIIRTVINLGGMDWKEADRVRKATGKKKPNVLFDMKDELIERFIKHGMTKEKANALFDLFVPFTNYAFNQAHAAAYSLVTYATSYLKTHYPVEFM